MSCVDIADKSPLFFSSVGYLGETKGEIVWKHCQIGWGEAEPSYSKRVEGPLLAVQ